MESEGVFIRHTSCPSCGSSDARAVYSNGTSYCFSCGRWYKDGGKRHYKVSMGTPMKELLHGEYRAIHSRALSEETCKAYNYTVGTDENGKVIQIATYYNNEGQRVAQKLRYKDKTFRFIGNPKEALMFGQQNFKGGGKKLTITEGEIDALSVREAFGKSFPIVSIKNGAGAAKKEILANAEWINSFEEIYLWFDNDEAGHKAIEQCIPLLPAGKVKIIRHPDYKDANEVLVNLGKAGVTQTFYNAEDCKPDGFVSPDELLDEVTKPIQQGIPWMYEGLTEPTYGRRYGEVVTLGAGVAIGKTDFLMQQIACDLKNNHKVATFMLEQNKVETLLRICGKLDGIFYHLPDTKYDKEQLISTVKSLQDKLIMYDNFGRIDWETIKSKIRSASVTYGIKLFYIDNLTALNSHADDERRHLDALMEEVASLAKELNVWILMVSHLNPPKKGASHEAGGRVEQSQFTGSRAIMRWSHFMLGVERNTLAETAEERNRGIIRCIKDRFSGKATGQTIRFVYDSKTGVSYPVDEEFEVEANEEEDF